MLTRPLAGVDEPPRGVLAELTVMHGDALSLPPAIEIQLVRVIQEALTNVRKHARASNVSVKLERVDGLARAVIRDESMPPCQIVKIRVSLSVKCRHGLGRRWRRFLPGLGQFGSSGTAACFHLFDRLTHVFG